jgi:hypothetical protein
MKRIACAGLLGMLAACCLEGSRAADPSCAVSCTDTGVRCTCVPACKATWEEKKSSKPEYSLKCEYACARGRDSWHAPDPECRCCPPCGNVYIKKRFYKTDGEEKVERVPKYEVRMVHAPCAGESCHGPAKPCWWNPLRLLPAFGSW